jgi:Protein of unknown function (DUF3078)
MKKRIAIIFAFTIAFNSIKAQVTEPDTVSYWKKKTSIGLNINQAAFSSNWKAGGVNSLGMNGQLSFNANYKKDKRSWDNGIDLAYGFVNNKGQGYRKTVDRIFLDTKYGQSLNKNWDLFTSLNFQSQFTDGYAYEADNSKTIISGIFAPAFITSGWGVEYHPVEYFKVRIAPIAPRLTIVKDPTRFIASVGPKPYGVNPPDEVRYEWFAFQMTADFNKDIAKNINLKWHYMMFANYETLQLKTIDHRMDVTLNAKVNKYINTTIGAIMLYDYDQDNGVQLSQMFTLGFNYTIQNFKE